MKDLFVYISKIVTGGGICHCVSVADLPHSYVVADGIEIGFGKTRYPFGFSECCIDKETPGVAMCVPFLPIAKEFSYMPKAKAAPKVSFFVAGGDEH